MLFIMWYIQNTLHCRMYNTIQYVTSHNIRLHHTILHVLHHSITLQSRSFNYVQRYPFVQVLPAQSVYIVEVVSFSRSSSAWLASRCCFCEFCWCTGILHNTSEWDYAAGWYRMQFVRLVCIGLASIWHGSRLTQDSRQCPGPAPTLIMMMSTPRWFAVPFLAFWHYFYYITVSHLYEFC